VPWKGAEQLAALAMHRIRLLVIQGKHAASNQVLGLLSEFGHTDFGSMQQLLRAPEDPVASALPMIPETLRPAMQLATSRVRQLAVEQEQVEAEIARWHEASDSSPALRAFPGWGTCPRPRWRPPSSAPIRPCERDASFRRRLALFQPNTRRVSGR
jgi:hypothetical protein